MCNFRMASRGPCLACRSATDAAASLSRVRQRCSGYDLNRNEHGLLVDLARDAAVAYAHVHNEMLHGQIAALESELSRVSATSVGAPG